LHTEWKKQFDDALLQGKRDKQKADRSLVYSNPINSTARRKYHLSHKGRSIPLPAIMKNPNNPTSLLTGHEVNEMWGTSATATRPNTMPTVSTEEGPAPWLDPNIWQNIRTSIAPLEAQLMAPISELEIHNFLNHTGNSSPGTDGIQYNIIKFMCFHPDFTALQLSSILQRFLNMLLRQKQIPPSMKTALLTFIHKAGDPLQYSNYQGISLLSCLFKLITGTLNGRLQRILHETMGLDCNQGANRKGVHAAHKATVIMNIIADARVRKQPLHIIYTDIKGAFPSVPYQAFADALTSLGLGNGFLDLIINMQTDFTCTAKGPTGYSSAKPKASGVHEGDCLSPTLFCLVLNMYFRWVQSAELGYEMLSIEHSSPALCVKVPVNGYADDMALIGNSHDEAQKILTMLERFLSFYGMSLNAGKCG
jgi:hypothetical protein